MREEHVYEFTQLNELNMTSIPQFSLIKQLDLCQIIRITCNFRLKLVSF